MRKITRLVAQKKNKERVNVYLDGEFAFGLALIEAARLKVGQTLSEEEIAALQAEDDFHHAYQRALDYLSRRPRSRREMEQYLTRKKLTPALIERVLERLSRAGLVDDLAFAEYWIENRQQFRPRGAVALRHELRQKGLDETIITRALEASELDELESAYRVGLKRLSRLRDINDRWQFHKRMTAYLGRRGFGWDTIRTVSEQLWEEHNNED